MIIGPPSNAFFIGPDPPEVEGPFLWVQTGGPDVGFWIDGDPLAIAVDANTIVLGDDLDLPDTGYLIRIGAYMDGNGPSDANQQIRGVLYSAAGKLVAAGDTVTVMDGQAEGWVWLPFIDVAGLSLPPGSYRPGIQAGATSDGARIYVGGDGLRTTFDAPFIDGPPATLSGGTTADVSAWIVLELLPAIRVPDSDSVDDDYLATLPWDVTQRIFGASGPLRRSRVSATAGWYGTKFDGRRGAFAIVRSDGPLADLVGERIQVTRRTSGAPASIAVYVTDERDFPDELADEDLMLTRRGFLALGALSLDDIAVAVSVLA